MATFPVGVLIMSLPNGGRGSVASDAANYTITLFVVCPAQFEAEMHRISGRKLLVRSDGSHEDTKIAATSEIDRKGNAQVIRAHFP